MSGTHFVGKVAQKAIVVNEHNHVLLMRDPREEVVIWELPGGRLNENEDPQKGLIRELKEEFGVDFIVKEVVYVDKFFQKNEQQDALVIVYLCELSDPQKDFVLEEAEVCEVGWFTLEDALELNLFPEYRSALEIFFRKNNV